MGFLRIYYLLLFSGSGYSKKIQKPDSWFYTEIIAISFTLFECSNQVNVGLCLEEIFLRCNISRQHFSKTECNYDFLSQVQYFYWQSFIIIDLV